MGTALVGHYGGDAKEAQDSYRDTPGSVDEVFVHVLRIPLKLVSAVYMAHLIGKIPIKEIIADLRAGAFDKFV